MVQQSSSVPWAALNVSFGHWGSAPQVRSAFLQRVVTALSCQSFPLTFPICPKLVSDAYKAAAELLQIAAWGFTENPAWYCSLNAIRDHKLPLHSLCFMDSIPKSGCLLQHHGGLWWPLTWIWLEVCIGISHVEFCILCHFGNHKTSSLLFDWIPERIFNLYANRAFAQGCFATGWITC